MRKSVQVSIPRHIQPQRKISLEDRIMVIAKTPMTADEIVKKINSKSSNIRGLLSNMCRDGRLEISRCEHCKIGTMYKVKK